MSVEDQPLDRVPEVIAMEAVATIELVRDTSFVYDKISGQELPTRRLVDFAHDAIRFGGALALGALLMPEYIAPVVKNLAYRTLSAVVGRKERRANDS